MLLRHTGARSSLIDLRGCCLGPLSFGWRPGKTIPLRKTLSLVEFPCVPSAVDLDGQLAKSDGYVGVDVSESESESESESKMSDRAA
jgi:hypothetical protein